MPRPGWEEHQAALDRRQEIERERSEKLERERNEREQRLQQDAETRQRAWAAKRNRLARELTEAHEIAAMAASGRADELPSEFKARLFGVIERIAGQQLVTEAEQAVADHQRAMTAR